MKRNNIKSNFEIDTKNSWGTVVRELEMEDQRCSTARGVVCNGAFSNVRNGENRTDILIITWNKIVIYLI